MNYNEKKLLENCLKSLNQITYENFEIILVDNNSDDDSVKFVKENFPKILIIKLDENKGFAEPNNIGAKKAKGKYLLFLNNDTEVTENFLTEMVNVIENDESIAICQSLLLKPDGRVDSSGDFIDELGVVFNSKSMISDIREISSARGASMLIRKTIFIQLKGFDEMFFVSFEDVDLGWRAWILGYKVIVIPSSIVYHHGGSTIQKIHSQIAFHGFKNQLAMKITNFEFPLAITKVIKFLFVYGIREIRILMDYKIRGNTSLSSTKYEKNIAPKPNISIVLQSISWIFKNLKYLRTKSSEINSTRKISSATLAKLGILVNDYH